MGSLMNFSAIPFYRVCINENVHGNVSGEIYCGIIPDGTYFVGIEDLILQLEDLMDKIKFPQSTVQKRSFKNVSSPQNLPLKFIQESQTAMKKYNADDKMGKIATIIVQIQFRQNASWQGRIKWVEEESIYDFESELDFIKKVDSIIK